MKVNKKECNCFPFKTTPKSGNRLAAGEEGKRTTSKKTFTIETKTRKLLKNLSLFTCSDRRMIRKHVIDLYAAHNKRAVPLFTNMEKENCEILAL